MQKLNHAKTKKFEAPAEIFARRVEYTMSEYFRAATMKFEVFA